MALLLQQPRADGGIDASGEADDDALVLHAFTSGESTDASVAINDSGCRLPAR